MRKTHKDRINLIDRLERQYARKVQLRNQVRSQQLKNMLRRMRGRHVEMNDIDEAPVDMYYHKQNIAF